MGDRQFELQLQGYSLTTAEILYFFPDYPLLLQTYLWQDYDEAPRFPKLRGFLDFWAKNLEGPLHKVRICHQKLISPAEFSYMNGEFKLH